MSNNLKNMFSLVEFHSSCYLIPGYISNTEDIEALYENMLQPPLSYDIKDMKDIKDIEYLPIDDSFKPDQYNVYFCNVDNMDELLCEIDCETVETDLGTAFDIDNDERMEVLKKRFPGIHAYCDRDNDIYIAFIAK